MVAAADKTRAVAGELDVPWSRRLLGDRKKLNQRLFVPVNHTMADGFDLNQRFAGSPFLFFNISG